MSAERADSSLERPQLDTLGGRQEPVDRDRPAWTAEREAGEEAYLPVAWQVALQIALSTAPSGHAKVKLVQPSRGRVHWVTVWCVELPEGQHSLPQLTAEGLREFRARSLAWRTPHELLENLMGFQSMQPMAAALDPLLTAATMNWN